MFSSLRSRLWLSYGFIIVIALTIVTLILFLSLIRNPIIYRQTTERLNAVKTVLIQRSQESQALPLSTLAEDTAKTFKVRVLIFSEQKQLLSDTSAGREAPLPYPRQRIFLRNLPIERDQKGGSWLYSIEHLPDGTFLMLAEPRPRFSLINIFSDEFLPVFILSGVIALALSLLVAFMFAGWIANPLQRVVNAAKEMPSAETKPVEVAGPYEVQELTRAFNSMVERVRASQRSQREFVANVSHELKTPLTSIQGFAQAILDGTAATDESRKQAAQVIYSESDRMHRMVLDLLDLAKLDAGTADLKMSPVNVGAMLNAVAEKFTPQSTRAGVRIEVNIPSSLPPLIADGDRMSQVFTNLVDNALKFTPVGGTISLDAKVEQDEMSISVMDTGEGIPKEAQARIFQRFYQADPARRGGETHGAGLGLAIAQEIIAAHGGRISVRSGVGEGTTMEVILPLAPPDKTKKVRRK